MTVALRVAAAALLAGSVFMVDLTDMTNPYVVVAPQWAFRLSAEDATAIRDALFTEP